MSVLRNVSKDDTTQYVLALLDEALAGARKPGHPMCLCSTHAQPRRRQRTRRRVRGRGSSAARWPPGGSTR